MPLCIEYVFFFLVINFMFYVTVRFILILIKTIFFIKLMIIIFILLLNIALNKDVFKSSYFDFKMSRPICYAPVIPLCYCITFVFFQLLCINCCIKKYLMFHNIWYLKLNFNFFLFVNVILKPTSTLNKNKYVIYDSWQKTMKHITFLK